MSVRPSLWTDTCLPLSTFRWLLAAGCSSRSCRPLGRAAPRASEQRECAQVIHRGAKGETTAFHELTSEATCPHSALRCGSQGPASTVRRRLHAVKASLRDHRAALEADTTPKKSLSSALDSPPLAPRRIYDLFDLIR